MKLKILFFYGTQMIDVITCETVILSDNLRTIEFVRDGVVSIAKGCDNFELVDNSVQVSLDDSREDLKDHFLDKNNFAKFEDKDVIEKQNEYIQLLEQKIAELSKTT